MAVNGERMALLACLVGLPQAGSATPLCEGCGLGSLKAKAGSYMEFVARSSLWVERRCFTDRCSGSPGLSGEVKFGSLTLLV